MNERKLLTKAVEEAERELHAATRVSEVRAAAKEVDPCEGRAAMV